MKYLALPLLFISSLALNAQTAAVPPQPKLVVGIVVDQMSYEFLYRYKDTYNTNGFNKLLKEGFSCENAHYNYIPTYTGPGHASIYTGSVPAINGIVSNDWFDEKTNTYVYVTDDLSVKIVGADTTGGQMSPKNMLSTTVTDMLKLSNQQRSKVIGISMKDRGAILPAGHSADAAYWYDGRVNAWVTSTYYMDALPQWVNTVNAEKQAQNFMNTYWNLYLPASSYTNATADSVPWETVFIGEESNKFPHYMLFNGNSESIKSTPFGNTMTTTMAKAAIKNENLGKDNIPDFLCVSYSCTDYVGHAYGPHSVEIEDTYLRLDAEIADLISYLESTVGKGNFLMFLTADHGVSPVPQYLETLKIPSGTTTEYYMRAKMDTILRNNLGDAPWIKSYINQQIYLNDSLLKAKNISKETVFNALYSDLMQEQGVAYVILLDALESTTLQADIKERITNGIYPKRCGDIQILYDPYWFEAYRPTGTTHGSHFSYDAHVPLIFYGWNIKAGETHRDITVTDIAPTLSALLRISEPNGCVGKVITEIIK